MPMSLSSLTDGIQDRVQIGVNDATVRQLYAIA